MQIEKLNDTDVNAVQNLISQSFEIHPEFYLHRFPIRSDRCILIVKDEGEVVGVAGAFRNSLHPDYLETLIAVLPSHRRRGIATDLLKALRSKTSSFQPFQGLRVAFYKGQNVNELFLEKNGFACNHICRCLELSVLSEPYRIHDPRSSEVLIPLSGFIVSDATRNAVLSFLWTRYSEEHTSNPPRLKNAEDWSDIALGDCDLDLSLALVHEGAIVGVTTCGPVDGTELEVSWCFAQKDLGPIVEAARLSKMMVDLLARARVSGAENVSIEVDETDRGLVAAIGEFALQKREDWVIFLGK